MLDIDASKTALHNLFHRTPITQLDALCHALKTRSRMSVFRRLTLLGYLTGYTHTARYYTLREIPQFDEFGLWHYGGVGFCRAGTLKAAVAELVEKSEAGRTHLEVQDMLRVRVRNELLDHVRAGQMGRRLLDDKHWLYLSAKASCAAKQWARRQAQGERAAQALGPLTAAVTIEVLVEVLLASRVQVSAQEVARRLSRRGVTVALQQVEWVFERYDLGKKKRDPASLRSRP
jgi:hypothetical protein